MDKILNPGQKTTAAKFKKTKKRVITRRGVLWLGQTCNIKCYFCYFRDRIDAKDHPEHPFMSIEKAKQICSTLVDHYKNNAIDIQGGEPTIYRHINELIEHCRKIGLLPTLITNGLVLEKKDACRRLKYSGVRDLLVSVHGLDDIFDKIVGVPGASLKQARALANFQEMEIPFRFNCVLSRLALPQLTNIARLAISTGARVVNFIAFNPFEDQRKAGKRSSNNVPSYNEVVPSLNDAMDVLLEAGIECNVRYFPLCMVHERHRPSMYNFQQLPFDLHEWDYSSWSWTGMTPQRMKGGELSSLISLEEATSALKIFDGMLKPLAPVIIHLSSRAPWLKKLFESLKRT